MGPKENACEIVNWFYEHDNESPAVINVGKCLDLLSDYQIIRRDSAL
jgi:hypothetical protein